MIKIYNVCTVLRCWRNLKLPNDIEIKISEEYMESYVDINTLQKWGGLYFRKYDGWHLMDEYIIFMYTEGNIIDLDLIKKIMKFGII